MINNLHQLRSTLSLYPGTEQRLTELADSLNKRLVGLSKEQVCRILHFSMIVSFKAAHLLASLALAPLLPLLENRDGTPLSTVPGCHPQVAFMLKSLKTFNMFTQRLWLQLVQGWILCFLLLTSCCCLPPGCSSPLSTESKSPSMPSRASMRSICNCTRRCKILLTVSKWVFCLGLLSRLPHFCKYKGEICCA